MGRLWIGAAIAGASLLAGSGAWAHHSGAMFDGKKVVTLTGTVKEMQWVNPHSWLEINVPGPGGKTVQWSVELAGPDALLRAGYRKSNPKAGDKVTVEAHPLRDGRRGAAIISIKLADGKVIGRNNQ